MEFVNDEQHKWMHKNFMLTINDIPTDWMEHKDFIETLCGRQHFRGDDYQGDSMSFAEDCLISLLAADINKLRFQRIIQQMVNYWMPEAEKMEYYELLSNFKEILIEFVKFVRQANEHQSMNEVRDLIEDIPGITHSFRGPIDFSHI